MTDTLYVGFGFGSPGPGTVVIEPDGVELDHSATHDHPDLPSHSPDGFQCGYGGSGPAALSIALLYDVTGDTMLARKLYRDFTSEIVSNLPGEWTLAADVIETWIDGRVADA